MTSATSRNPRLFGLAAALLVLLLASRAAATPSEPIQFTVPVVCTAGDSSIDLDPGRYLPEPEWESLDNRLRMLEDDQTRLEAENKTLREYDEPTPWKLIGGALLLGIAGGMYISR